VSIYKAAYIATTTTAAADIIGEIPMGFTTIF